MTELEKGMTSAVEDLSVLFPKYTFTYVKDGPAHRLEVTAEGVHKAMSIQDTDLGEASVFRKTVVDTVSSALKDLP